MSAREPVLADRAPPDALGNGEAPMFSRPASGSLFGKCDERLDVPMPKSLRDLCIRLGALDDKSAATYVREVVESHVLREIERVKRIVKQADGDFDGMNLR